MSKREHIPRPQAEEREGFHTDLKDAGRGYSKKESMEKAAEMREFGWNAHIEKRKRRR